MYSYQIFITKLDLRSFVNPYNAGIDFRRQNLTSVDESDVCRRQILTSKVDPRAVRVNNIYNIHRHMYLNETERADYANKLL